jgi:hypothetical protein
VCLRVVSVGSAESMIIVSAGSAERMMLSAHAGSMDTLSTGAESIILSALPTESITLRAVWSCVMLTAVATKKQQSAILMIVKGHLSTAL